MTVLRIFPFFKNLFFFTHDLRSLEVMVSGVSVNELLYVGKIAEFTGLD